MENFKIDVDADGKLVVDVSFDALGSSSDALPAIDITGIRVDGSNSPLAVRQIKRCVDQGLDLPLTAALELEREYWAQLIPPGDYREGVRAWFEKRAPIYPYDPLPDVD